jgi:hypothetical protein
MKLIKNALIVFLMSLSYVSLTSQIIGNPKTMINSDDYLFISFYEDSNLGYISCSVLGEIWSSGGSFYKDFTGFKDSTNTLEPDMVKYETIFTTGTGRSVSLLEVRDSTNTYPLGILYSGDYSIGDTTLSVELYDAFVEFQDTLNVHNGTNDQMPFTVGQQSVNQTSYPLSFDEPDNYASAYTPGELAYVVEHDANGYKLELIQDTDRSNILVGFRYKSGLDNNTYTKFIVPNN